MQNTLLIGYLGKDPEMKYIPSGTAIATYRAGQRKRPISLPWRGSWHCQNSQFLGKLN
jgi:single-stranded DNA-binding protein